MFKLCLIFKWVQEKQWTHTYGIRLLVKTDVKTDAVVHYWLASRLMSWLQIYEHTPEHLWGVAAVARFEPGAACQARLHLATSNEPTVHPSCHSSPHHDRQIHLSRKEELILHIWDSDRLASPQGFCRTDEIRLKLLWGFTGNWPCQSHPATHCCTTSLTFNVTPAYICLLWSYFHNANVSIADFDCPLAAKLLLSLAWCRIHNSEHKR